MRRKKGEKSFFWAWTKWQVEKKLVRLRKVYFLSPASNVPSRLGKVVLIETRVCISTTRAKTRSQCALWVCPRRKVHKMCTPGSFKSTTLSSWATLSQSSVAVSTLPRCKTVYRMASRRRKLTTSRLSNGANCQKWNVPPRRNA